MKVVNARDKKYKAEAGAMLIFFAAIIMPLLFFVFMISLDIAAFINQKTRAQQFTDEAALRALKYYPRADQINQSINALAMQFGFNPGAVSVDIGDGTLSVQLSERFPMFFAPGIALFANRDIGDLPITAVTISRTTPFDVALVVDRSGYLGAESGLIDNQPAANYFVTQAGADSVEARTRTENCYNSVFSSFKQRAIEIYDLLSSFGSFGAVTVAGGGSSAIQGNAVGIGFFPGLSILGGPISRSVDFVRSIEATTQKTNSSSTILNPGEALPFTADPMVPTSMQCGLLAQQEARYQIPNRHPDTRSLWGRSNPVGLKLARINNLGAVEYDPQYFPFIEGREVIWSRAANTGVVMDVGALLINASSMAISGGHIQRGGLSRSAQKIVLILSADAPRDSNGVRLGSPGNTVAQDIAQALSSAAGVSVQAMMENSEDLNLIIHYVLIDSRQMPRPLNITDLEARSSDLRQIFENSHAILPTELKERLKFEVIYLDLGSPNIASMIGSIIFAKRTSVISNNRFFAGLSE